MKVNNLIRIIACVFLTIATFFVVSAMFGLFNLALNEIILISIPQIAGLIIAFRLFDIAEDK